MVSPANAPANSAFGSRVQQEPSYTLQARAAAWATSGSLPFSRRQ